MEASQRPVNSQQNSTLNENQPKTAQQCPRKTSQSAEVQQVPKNLSASAGGQLEHPSEVNNST
jgi:hypothetical protein